MDMLYHLPFRDWMELNKTPAQSIAAAADDPSDSGDSAGGATNGRFASAFAFLISAFW